jgi:hypothetical protein
MTDISLALLEENKRLQVRIDELQIDLTKHAARPNAATLYAKKAEVMKKVSRIKETGKHQQGWRYATSEDVKDEVRKAMAEVGLSLSFELISYDLERSDNRVIVTGVIAYTLECGETGATVTKTFPAEAVDYGRNSGDELDSDSDMPPGKKQTGKKPPATKAEPIPIPEEDNRPWQEKRPSMDGFMKMACDHFGLEKDDILDELKAADFKSYKPVLAPKMWKALEKAQKAATEETAQQDIDQSETDDLESEYSEIFNGKD